jgi:hypothetical protein
MEPQPDSPQEMVPFADPGRVVNPDVQPWPQASPLALAGQIANRVAGQNIFPRYLSEKSAHTSQRHARGTPHEWTTHK